ncbi:MAG: YdcF family protein [Burkholderiaceae bacterium]
MRVFCRIIGFLAITFLITAAAVAVDGLMDRPAKADAVLVPGNMVYPQGMPSARLAARLDVAVLAYKRQLVPLVIVSGGTGKEGVDEASAMASYLEARGVPRRAILLDSQGNDTAATARNVAGLLHASGLHTVLIATQYFHVTRVRLALEKAGVIVSGSLHARYFEMRDLYSLPREVLGLIAYAMGMKGMTGVQGRVAKAG